MRCLSFLSPWRDGWRNLAADEYFLTALSPDDILLYFYVNENAVVIGRNQNAWRECNLANMEADGVQLVRRMSGGGAVYHDGGNLNFSFHLPKSCYDVERQLTVILNALRALGVEAAFTGRNDLTAGGKKFSGSAFCARGDRMLHHGTLLVSADLEKLSGYLNVSEQKIKSKGVTSVRARVCNLSDLVSGLTTDDTRRAVEEAFAAAYGPWTPWRPESAKAELEALYEKHRSWTWRLGESAPFTWEGEKRFPWGEVQLGLSVQNGVVDEAVLHTDALDTQLPRRVAHALAGVQFSAREMSAALRSAGGGELAELAEWLEENS